MIFHSEFTVLKYLNIKIHYLSLFLLDAICQYNGSPKANTLLILKIEDHIIAKYNGYFQLVLL